MRLGLRHSEPCFTAAKYVFATTKGSFTVVKQLVSQSSINTRNETFFPPNIFYATFVSCFFLCAILSDFEPSVTTTVPKNTFLTKQHRSGSISQVASPPLDDPRRFISREAERLYHESLCIRSFVSERGFPTLNAFFNFTIQTRGWQTLCAPPPPDLRPRSSTSSTPTYHSGSTP